MSDTYNCTLGPPWVNITLSRMYKNEKKLLYPVNVGRNIARESAPTHYVFASDIELYPSPNLPERFLEMIRRRDQAALQKSNPKVYVLSIFEVNEKYRPPNNKTHLVSLRRVLASGAFLLALINVPLRYIVCAVALMVDRVNLMAIKFMKVCVCEGRTKRVRGRRREYTRTCVRSC